MKVALVYDRVNKWGGAERILLSLHKLFPKAPLYTSVYNQQTAPWASVFDVRPSFLQQFPLAMSGHEFYAPLMPAAFESFSFDEYDLVISVTSEAAKGVITKPHTKHICICLTPTRYLWSGYDEYFENPYLRFFSKPLVTYLRGWDKIAAQRPNAFIAISQTVQERIKKYYQRDADVIYPAVDALKQPAKLSPSINHSSPFSKPYFLIVSRLSKLTAYKRVDLAIKASNITGTVLKIVGDGRDIKYFRKIAGKTVEFAGKVSDETLREYYKNSRALLFPGIEDFGLVMVEAQSFGKPVIAYRKGGATEIVVEGKTGEFFEEQTPTALAKILENFNEKRYNRRDCSENAKRFSSAVFENKLLAFIKRTQKIRNNLLY